MDFLNLIKDNFVISVKECFDLELNSNDILVNETRKEFVGDYTFVIFPYVKILKKSPLEIGDKLGNWMLKNDPNVIAFETIQGFLNLTLSDDFWMSQLIEINKNENYGFQTKNGKKVLVEFSSPNTNKPLHLGHVRNILLGWSCSKILQAIGYEVVKTQVINDRGIAICKSMLAWQKFGNQSTPATLGIKGDHFVGDFYVLFEQKFKEEYELFQEAEAGQKLFLLNKKPDQDSASFFKEYKNKYFNEYSVLGAEAKKMLIDWENHDPKVISLWKKMNNWVYEGFNETYNLIGVNFDSLYFESDTYLLGKKAVELGLKQGVFFREPDESVWIDLEDVGMDKKIILRSDGTSVYITQDIGTAQQRYLDFGIDKMVYTVADEQDYHFKVLFEILRRLGEPYADGLHHLSYGMVDLPTGKMKSREGTVVDADDLINEVIDEVRAMSAEREEINSLPTNEQESILRKIGLGALKFFIIKVQPQKRMIFDPKESVDMQGQTGPYIQNAYVRIQSIKRKAEKMKLTDDSQYTSLNEQEKLLVKHILMFPYMVEDAGAKFDPSIIANFSYSLAKDFHRFYHDVRILNAESMAAAGFRTELCNLVGQVLYKSFDLIGIEMPERM